MSNCVKDFYFFLRCYERLRTGAVYSWGSGQMGQLGYRKRTLSKLPKDREGCPYQPYPLEIEQLRHIGIREVAAGDGHTIAVSSDGSVYAWGARQVYKMRNSACGQLGLSTTRDLPTDNEGYPYQPTPRKVDLLSGVNIVQIACGDAHTVALTEEGLLYSWGGGGCGQLGHPNTSSMPKDEDGCAYQPKPKLITALKNFKVSEIACGKAHSVAVLGNGAFYSWGAGACGQLGHPDTSSFPSDEDGYPFQPVPRCVQALKNQVIVHAACGDVHTMVLTEQGAVFCFGGGSVGQLGLGSIKNMPLDVDHCPFMPVPKKIEALKGIFIEQLSCGDTHSMALSKEGRVYAWGAAAFGQLGIPADEKKLPVNNEGIIYASMPQAVKSLENKRIVAISCGEAHSLVLADSGHLYSFGAYGCGQLGQDVSPDFCSGVLSFSRSNDSNDSLLDSFDQQLMHDEEEEDKEEQLNFEQERRQNSQQGSVRGSTVTSSIAIALGSEAHPGASTEENSIFAFTVNLTEVTPAPRTAEQEGRGSLEGSDLRGGERGAPSQAQYASDQDMSPPMPQDDEEEEPVSQNLNSLFSSNPRLVRSLLPFKVLKMASGGVHNICIMEKQPFSLICDLYRQFMENELTDFSFKVRYDGPGSEGRPQTRSFSNSVISQGYRNTDQVTGGTVQIHVHKFVLAGRSSFFEALFQTESRESIEEELKVRSQKEQQTFQIEEYEEERGEKERRGSLELKRKLKTVLKENSTVLDLTDPLTKEKLAKVGLGDVGYEALRRVVDFFYLDDVGVLTAENESHFHYISILKLARLFGLEQLVNRCEVLIRDSLRYYFEQQNRAGRQPQEYALLTQLAQNSRQNRSSSPPPPVPQTGSMASTSSASREQAGSREGVTPQQQQIQQHYYGQSRSRTASRMHRGPVGGVPNPLGNMDNVFFTPSGNIVIVEEELFHRVMEESITINLFERRPIDAQLTQSRRPTLAPSTARTESTNTASGVAGGSNTQGGGAGGGGLRIAPSGQGTQLSKKKSKHHGQNMSAQLTQRGAGQSAYERPQSGSYFHHQTTQPIESEGLILDDDQDEEEEKKEIVTGLFDPSHHTDSDGGEDGNNSDLEGTGEIVIMQSPAIQEQEEDDEDDEDSGNPENGHTEPRESQGTHEGGAHVVGAAGRGNAQATGGGGRRKDAAAPRQKNIATETALSQHPRGRVSETESMIMSQLNKPELSDVIILLENETVRVFAHRAVLACRSQYFKNMFLKNFKESGAKEIRIEEIKATHFQKLLKYMYSDAETLSLQDAILLMPYADRFQVQIVKQKAEVLLSPYIGVGNVCHMFKLANAFNCTRLSKSCLYYIEEHYDEVIMTDGFACLDKEEMLMVVRLNKKMSKR